jgi:hypothetical protein
VFSGDRGSQPPLLTLLLQKLYPRKTSVQEALGNVLHILGFKDAVISKH